jgi:hypothetical protein
MFTAKVLRFQASGNQNAKIKSDKQTALQQQRGKITREDAHTETSTETYFSLQTDQRRCSTNTREHNAGKHANRDKHIDHLPLQTDQRRCSTSIGAPPRFQKSPNSDPQTQEPNLGAPIPTQSAAEKSKDFSAHLADQEGGHSGRVPGRHI